MLTFIYIFFEDGGKTSVTTTKDLDNGLLHGIAKARCEEHLASENFLGKNKITATSKVVFELFCFVPEFKEAPITS